MSGRRNSHLLLFTLLEARWAEYARDMRRREKVHGRLS